MNDENFDMAQARVRGTRFAMWLLGLVGLLSFAAVASILASSPDGEHVVACIFIVIATIAFLWLGFKDTKDALPEDVRSGGK